MCMGYARKVTALREGNAPRGGTSGAVNARPLHSGIGYVQSELGSGPSASKRDSTHHVSAPKDTVHLRTSSKALSAIATMVFEQKRNI